MIEIGFDLTQAQRGYFGRVGQLSGPVGHSTLQFAGGTLFEPESCARGVDVILHNSGLLPVVRFGRDNVLVLLSTDEAEFTRLVAALAQDGLDEIGLTVEATAYHAAASVPEGKRVEEDVDGFSFGIFGGV